MKLCLYAFMGMLATALIPLVASQASAFAGTATHARVIMAASSGNCWGFGTSVTPDGLCKS